MYCDLHTHSIRSDGCATPEELIEEAKRLDLVIALTDHNVVSGLPAFIAAAQKAGIEAVAGTELSTEYGGHDVHVVGLFLRPEYYSAVENFVRQANEWKAVSNLQLVENLARAGYPVDYEAICASSSDKKPNRVHFAAHMMQRGYVNSIAEAFAGLLSPVKGVYIPPQRITALDAIRFLRSIHAVPVLAHPFLNFTLPELREFLPQAKEAGLMAMETRYPLFTSEENRQADMLVSEFSLLPSGGSDYHGERKPDIHLGTGTGNLAIPLSYYENLKAAAQEA